MKEEIAMCQRAALLKGHVRTATLGSFLNRGASEMSSASASRLNVSDSTAKKQKLVVFLHRAQAYPYPDPVHADQNIRRVSLHPVADLAWIPLTRHVRMVSMPMKSFESRELSVINMHANNNWQPLDSSGACHGSTKNL